MSKTSIPSACIEVKCMVHRCPNQAMHKVAETNIYDPSLETEAADHAEFKQRHEKTSYICSEHFNLIMNREEFYGDLSKYTRPKPVAPVMNVFLWLNTKQKQIIITTDPTIKENYVFFKAMDADNKEAIALAAQEKQSQNGFTIIYENLYDENF